MTHVLAVDDDGEILNLVSTVAQELGYSIEAVDHADRFMASFDQTKPDIIVLDLVIPDMDGVELIRWLMDRGCDAKIIVTSGVQGGDYGEVAARFARAAGATRVETLPKPFRLHQLRSLLKD